MGNCTRPEGDFGRAAPSFTHDTLLPALGWDAAQSRGEATSTFQFTIAEREMRDRMWQFFTAPHGKDWFFNAKTHGQNTRILPEVDATNVAADYYNFLRAQHYPVQTTLYRHVARDAHTDIALIPPVFRVICDVILEDQQRAIAVQATPLQMENAPIDVQARRQENLMMIGWFTRSLRYRERAYSTAFERLLVERPDPAGQELADAIGHLEPYVQRAEAGYFCVDGRLDVPAPSSRSRFSPNNKGGGTGTSRMLQEPVYRK